MPNCLIQIIVILLVSNIGIAHADQNNISDEKAISSVAAKQIQGKISCDKTSQKTPVSHVKKAAPSGRDTVNIYCATPLSQISSAATAIQTGNKGESGCKPECLKENEWLVFIPKVLDALAWPIFALILIVAFKKELGRLIDRVKKGKVFGQEFELEDSLNQLNKTATAAAAEVVPIQSEESEKREIDSSDEIKEILTESTRSPKTALIRLSAYIERDASQLLASIGQIKGRRNVPLSKSISELVEKCGLPTHIPSSLKLFSEVRNKLIHRGDADDEDVLRAIDSGITILKALDAVPREVHVVYHPGVEIFSDVQCHNLIENGKGIILESQSPGGVKKSFRIYPSTRTHFQKGKRVGWEWSFEHTWGEAWYKDPDSGAVKYAWTSSAEFIGRNLDEI